MLLLLVASLLAATIASPLDSGSHTVCSFLYQRYPKYVAWDPLNINALESIGNATLWTQINKDYWNRRNAVNRPTCAFFPADAQQVSVAVKKLNECPGVPFAIKSGGHQFNFGFSSVNKGVLFSFNQNLASTVPSSDGQSFVVGSGARWGDVYTEAHKTNKVVVGGRLSHIGVGGFILGGGLSYYSPQYGLACDNVLNFEVVLPNGTITSANSTSNPDLWWSLRGGGNRFAIVTRYTLAAYPEGVDGQVWGGVRTYDEADRKKLFYALAKFTRDYPDAKASVIPTHTFALPFGLAKVPLYFFFYDGPTPPPGLFADFDSVQSLSDSTKTRSYPDMANEAGGASLQGFATAARVDTFPNTEPANMSQFYEAHWHIYSKQAASDLFRNLDIQVMTFTPQPISTKLARASRSRGGNTLGLDPDHGDRIWIENSLIWASSACDSKCDAYLRDTADMVKAYQKSNMAGQKPTNYRAGDVDFISNNPLFMNDAAFYQDVYSSYGSSNHARLIKIQRAYDTKGFMFRQPGGWNFT